jgi:hypothetical protein
VALLGNLLDDSAHVVHGETHECVHLGFRALKVLDAECVDGYCFYPVQEAGVDCLLIRYLVSEGSLRMERREKEGVGT